jgi:catechol 2,3-dioxygenase-like lactoylglutathione lyase family enzyme
MIKVGSLEHVALAYRDTDAAARWFCDVLGFEIVRQALHPAHGVNLYFLKDPAGRGVIEVIPMPKADDERLGDLSTNHVHVAFDVEDLDAAVASLEEAGLRVEGPRLSMAGTQGVFFRGPEGTPMQLVQRDQPLLSR